MKTIEEKAKAYDNALGWMREVYPTLTGATKEDAEHYFPELRESEDARIRKAIDEIMKLSKAWEIAAKYGLTAGDIRKWLERQKEQKPADISGLRDWKYIVDAVLTEHEGIGQYLDKPETERIAKKLQERFSIPQSKPAEWSEEDEETIELLKKILKVNHPNGKFKTTEAGTTDVKYISTDEIISRLESLRPQPKQEWSEEDTLMLTAVIQTLEMFGGRGTTGMQIDWLKSRIPPFKPSEKQMAVLLSAEGLLRANKYTENAKILAKLYEQLKKLM